MEVEAFPIGFTRGVRAHWRRRNYQRLEAGGKSAARGSNTQRLGGARRVGWRVRLRGLLVRRARAVRALVAAPGRLLARARDAYVGGMLAVARKASATALPGGGPEGIWARRVPRRKQLPPATARASEFEQRLVMEIYKSIVASKELTTMLHSSAAHLPAPPARA
ncbi:hypothetical protein D1007_23485 [Hordeum vulgare]|uniref:Predicted protein n=1 Tax=Hordeum vulgare subsp. vulgare TaxID=112509 RepID=F2DSM8_HORVV|nr:uncharacterized protein LOC123420407 [Hordeum vulgare subsp. vulgare]KAE8800981.1 hypothetical protein D1007_23485 [Hordeum vulgare]KAI5020494.1 hypothetical protein ZWY2020_045382 [Hordeum vulgare]BAJ98099.1 predicted protein [Hordeum vulgare subsp. vulgare]